MWSRYASCRNAIKPCNAMPAVDTMRAVTRWSSTLELDRSRNEVMLWSGAPSGQGGADDIISIIAKQGFDSRVASLRGMFGAAVYFAERSSKADAYAGNCGTASTVGETAFMFL